jgi:hypothetical protein
VVLSLNDIPGASKDVYKKSKKRKAKETASSSQPQKNLLKKIGVETHTVV